MKLVWRVASEERVQGFAFAQSCKLFPISERSARPGAPVACGAMSVASFGCV